MTTPLQRIVNEFDQVMDMVLKYRQRLKKEGVPSEDMRYMVVMFQSSLLQAVTSGNDKRYLDLGGGPT